MLPFINKFGSTLSLAALAILINFLPTFAGLQPQADTHARGSQAQATPQSAINEEVEAFIAHYIKTLESKDEAAIQALFVADERFAWFTDGVQSYASAKDVLAGMQRYAGIQFKTKATEIKVIQLGPSHVTVSSKFQTELTIPGSEDFRYGGIITWILEKHQSTKKWQVLQGHTSTPGGPPSGKNK